MHDSDTQWHRKHIIKDFLVCFFHHCHESEFGLSNTALLMRFMNAKQYLELLQSFWILLELFNFPPKIQAGSE